jgi:predicted enzyme related to lactoylglutathione lyase
VTRISYLDFSADDPERAIQFYNTVFGWQIKKWEGPFEYWEFKTGESNEPGIDGGLTKRSKPEESLTPFINVPSVDDYTSKIEANGGKVIQPKTAIPGIGYMVVFKDTENNRLGLMEEDQSAE